MKYDSNKPESADSPLGMQLSPSKPVFSMKISKSNTSITGGTEGLPDLLKQQVEETMRSLSSASGYPEGAVDNGILGKTRLLLNKEVLLLVLIMLILF